MGAPNGRSAISYELLGVERRRSCTAASASDQPDLDPEMSKKNEGSQMHPLAHGTDFSEGHFCPNYFYDLLDVTKEMYDKFCKALNECYS